MSTSQGMKDKHSVAWENLIIWNEVIFLLQLKTSFNQPVALRGMKTVVSDTLMELVCVIDSQEGVLRAKMM